MAWHGDNTHKQGAIAGKRLQFPCKARQDMVHRHAWRPCTMPHPPFYTHTQTCHNPAKKSSPPGWCAHPAWAAAATWTAPSRSACQSPRPAQRRAGRRREAAATCLSARACPSEAPTRQPTDSSPACCAAQPGRATCRRPAGPTPPCGGTWLWPLSRRPAGSPPPAAALHGLLPPAGSSAGTCSRGLRRTLGVGRIKRGCVALAWPALAGTGQPAAQACLAELCQLLP